MILTCPECAVSYKAKATSIGPNGRTVKCAQCDATWFAPAPEAELSTPDALQLEDIQADIKAEVQEDTALKATNLTPGAFAPPSARSAGKSADVIMRDKADAAKRRQRLRTIWLIWMVPLLLLTLLCFLLFFGRQSIAKSFPASVPFYNALGINVSQTGLRVTKPEVSAAIINGEPTFIINGEIKNLSDETRNLPMLELAFHNPEGDEVANWRVELPQPRLDAKEIIAFVSEYPNPPPDSVSLRYRLVN